MKDPLIKNSELQRKKHLETLTTGPCMEDKLIKDPKLHGKQHLQTLNSGPCMGDPLIMKQYLQRMHTWFQLNLGGICVASSAASNWCILRRKEL
jgi:hypothetical protein